jgi:hypothetical protein
MRALMVYTYIGDWHEELGCPANQQLALGLLNHHRTSLLGLPEEKKLYFVSLFPCKAHS